jgi:tRNA threonylcarbamoyl adenosine modification protein (Sua5/YciO/YrdC/YwlC family)
MNEKRKTIGLRVPDFPITQAILSGLHAPVMSTSLILPGNDVPESDPEEIEEKIGKSVDLIIDGGILAAEPTTVIDMADGEIKIIREGSGDTAPFLA